MMMRWFVALLFKAATAGTPECLVSNEDLAKWETPPLTPLMSNAGSPDLFPMKECFGFGLEEASIDEMQSAMETKGLTSVQLVLCYMMRNHQTLEYIK